MDHNAITAPCDPVVGRHQLGQRYDWLHRLLAQQGLMLGVLVKHRWPTSQLHLRGDQVRLLLRLGLSKSMSSTSIKKGVLPRSTKVPFSNGLHPHGLQWPDGLQEACGLSHQLCCCLGWGFPHWLCGGRFTSLGSFWSRSRKATGDLLGFHLASIGSLSLLRITRWVLGNWLRSSLHLRHLLLLWAISGRSPLLCRGRGWSRWGLRGALPTKVWGTPTIEAPSLHLGGLMKKRTKCSASAPLRSLPELAWGLHSTPRGCACSQGWNLHTHHSLQGCRGGGSSGSGLQADPKAQFFSLRLEVLRILLNGDRPRSDVHTQLLPHRSHPIGQLRPTKFPQGICKAMQDSTQDDRVWQRQVQFQWPAHQPSPSSESSKEIWCTGCHLRLRELLEDAHPLRAPTRLEDGPQPVHDARHRHGSAGNQVLLYELWDALQQHWDHPLFQT